MHLAYDLRIKQRGNLGRILADTADDLRDIVRLKLRIARIDALG